MRPPPLSNWTFWGLKWPGDRPNRGGTHVKWSKMQGSEIAKQWTHILHHDAQTGMLLWTDQRATRGGWPRKALGQAKGPFGGGFCFKRQESLRNWIYTGKAMASGIILNEVQRKHRKASAVMMWNGTFTPLRQPKKALVPQLDFGGK